MGERLTGDYRRHQDKNYLGSWDIPEGSDLILTIDHSEKEEVRNAQGTDRKIIIIWKERDYKPLIMNETNLQRITAAYGTRDIDKWEGRKVALYKEKVFAFGETTEAVRIRAYPPKSDEIICADCGIPISNHGKLTAKVIAERAVTRFGVPLCYNCGADRAALEDEGKNENNAG